MFALRVARHAGRLSLKQDEQDAGYVFDDEVEQGLGQGDVGVYVGDDDGLGRGGRAHLHDAPEALHLQAIGQPAGGAAPGGVVSAVVATATTAIITAVSTAVSTATTALATGVGAVSPG